MSRSLKTLIYTLLTVVLLMIGINIGVILYGNNWIIDSTEQQNSFAYGMILGASVKADGTLSQILKSRVDTAIDAYQDGLIEKIFVTGDDQEYYKEVTAIRAYLDKAGLPPTDIVFDTGGKNTYLSMLRAQQLVDDRVLVFTQQYHLSRSLYIARQLGLDAYGYIVDVHADVSLRQHIREFFARLKAFIEVALQTEGIGTSAKLVLLPERGV